MYPGRTTALALQGIIETDPTITDLSPFIDAANELVTELCVPEGYPANRLEMIERWLAAHFYAVRDPRTTSETAGGVGASYQHKEGLVLQSTSYGQMALMLDTNGVLSTASKLTEEGRHRRKIGVLHLGKSRSPVPDPGFVPIGPASVTIAQQDQAADSGLI